MNLVPSSESYPQALVENLLISQILGRFDNDKVTEQPWRYGKTDIWDA